MKKTVFALLICCCMSISVFLGMPASRAYADSTDTETVSVIALQGRANGWKSNANWVGFKLDRELDLSEDGTDVTVLYEYAENGVIRQVRTDNGELYVKNKTWSRYLVTGYDSTVRYSGCAFDNNVLPANTTIMTNWSATVSDTCSELTAKVESGTVTYARVRLVVTDGGELAFDGTTNWIRYNGIGNQEAIPLGISDIADDYAVETAAYERELNYCVYESGTPYNVTFTVRGNGKSYSAISTVMDGDRVVPYTEEKILSTVASSIFSVRKELDSSDPNYASEYTVEDLRSELGISSGMYFDGWRNQNGEIFDFGQKISADETVCAEWTEEIVSDFFAYMDDASTVRLAFELSETLDLSASGNDVRIIYEEYSAAKTSFLFHAGSVIRTKIDQGYLSAGETVYSNVADDSSVLPSATQIEATQLLAKEAARVRLIVYKNGALAFDGYSNSVIRQGYNFGGYDGPYPTIENIEGEYNDLGSNIPWTAPDKDVLLNGMICPSLASAAFEAERLASLGDEHSVILLSEGDYTFEGTIEFNSAVTLVGAGKKKTTLSASSGASVSDIKYTSSGGGFLAFLHAKEAISVYGLCIDSDGSDGIYAEGVLTVERAKFSGYYGILSTYSGAQSSVISDSQFITSHNALMFVGGEVGLFNNEISSTGENGIIIAEGATAVISGNSVFGYDSAISLDDGNVEVFDNKFEGTCIYSAYDGSTPSGTIVHYNNFMPSEDPTVNDNNKVLDINDRSAEIAEQFCLDNAEIIQMLVGTMPANSADAILAVLSEYLLLHPSVRALLPPVGEGSETEDVFAHLEGLLAATEIVDYRAGKVDLLTGYYDGIKDSFTAEPYITDAQTAYDNGVSAINAADTETVVDSAYAAAVGTIDLLRDNALWDYREGRISELYGIYQEYATASDPSLNSYYAIELLNVYNTAIGEMPEVVEATQSLDDVKTLIDEAYGRALEGFEGIQGDNEESFNLCKTDVETVVGDMIARLKVRVLVDDDGDEVSSIESGYLDEIASKTLEAALTELKNAYVFILTKIEKRADFVDYYDGIKGDLIKDEENGSYDYISDAEFVFEEGIGEITSAENLAEVNSIYNAKYAALENLFDESSLQSYKNEKLADLFGVYEEYLLDSVPSFNATNEGLLTGVYDSVASNISSVTISSGLDDAKEQIDGLYDSAIESFGEIEEQNIQAFDAYKTAAQTAVETAITNLETLYPDRSETIQGYLAAALADSDAEIGECQDFDDVDAKEIYWLGKITEIEKACEAENLIAAFDSAYVTLVVDETDFSNAVAAIDSYCLVNGITDDDGNIIGTYVPDNYGVFLFLQELRAETLGYSQDYGVYVDTLINEDADTEYFSALADLGDRLSSSLTSAYNAPRTESLDNVLSELREDIYAFNDGAQLLLDALAVQTTLVDSYDKLDVMTTNGYVSELYAIIEDIADGVVETISSALDDILLRAAKEHFIIALTEEFEGYTEEDYTANAWQGLEDYYEQGKTAIGTATTLSDIEEVKDTYASHMGGVYTEEDASSNTNPYIAVFWGYVSDLIGLYPEAEENLIQLYNEYIERLDACVDDSDLEEIKSDFNEEIASFKSEKLEEAISGAVGNFESFIEEFVSGLGGSFQESDFTDVITTQMEIIEGATNETEIKFLLEEAKNTVRDAAKEMILSSAKDEAKGEIDGVVSGLTDIEDMEAIAEIVTTYKNMIDGLSGTDAVAFALKEAKAAIAAEAASQKLEAKRTTTITELNEIFQDRSLDDYGEIKEKYDGLIEAAVSSAELSIIILLAENEVNAKEKEIQLGSKKASAQSDERIQVDEKYEDDSVIKGIILQVKERIASATSVNEIDVLLDSAEVAILTRIEKIESTANLEEAKTTAKNSLTVPDGYNAADFDSIINPYKALIGYASSKDAVDAILREANLAINTKIAEIEKAKEIAAEQQALSEEKSLYANEAEDLLFSLVTDFTVEPEPVATLNPIQLAEMFVGFGYSAINADAIVSFYSAYIGQIQTANSIAELELYKAIFESNIKGVVAVQEQANAQIPLDLTAAHAVRDDISQVLEKGSATEAELKKIRDDYDSLSDELKPYVSNYADFVYFREKAATNDRIMEMIKIGLLILLIVLMLVFLIIALRRNSGKYDDEELSKPQDEPRQYGGAGYPVAAQTQTVPVGQEVEESEPEEPEDIVVEDTDEPLYAEKDTIEEIEEAEEIEIEADDDAEIETSFGDQFVVLDDMSDELPLLEDEKALRVRNLRKPFIENLVALDDKIKIFYSQLKNELLSNRKVKNRLTKRNELFRFEKQTMVRLSLSGKTLKVYLALNPADYDETEYKHKDVSEIIRYQETPMLIRVRTEKSAKRVLGLISGIEEKFGLVPKSRFTATDYVKELIDKPNVSLGRLGFSNLIISEANADDTVFLSDRNALKCVEAVEIDDVAKKFEHKEDVSLARINEAFSSGEIVNRSTLRKRKVISKSTDFINIIAEGTLSKPLNFVADSYDTDAVKMILLTGGSCAKIKYGR